MATIKKRKTSSVTVLPPHLHTCGRHDESFWKKKRERKKKKGKLVLKLVGAA